MKTRNLLYACAMSALATAQFNALGADQTTAPKAAAPKTTTPQTLQPDILILLVDDLAYGDVSWHGGKIKTPYINSIAASGARLEQFYVQPVCSPTRAALLTGRYPMRYGLQVGVIRPWAKYGLPLEERTLPQALRETGYSTAICGKWHLGSFDPNYWPNARGFDHAYGHLFGAIDYFNHDRDGQPDWYRDGKPLQETGYSTNLIGRDAANVLREQPKNKPLFLYVPFNGVHAPLQVPESYKEPYKGLPPRRRSISGMFAAVDESVGEILKALDETGRRQNTLIVFASDNGGPNAADNGGLHGRKGTVYEGGVRSSGVVSWPGHVKPGTAISEPLHIVDFFPTFLKLVGAPLDSQHQKLPLDGRDILPTLTAGQLSPHQELLLNTTPSGGAIRVGDWKLIVKPNVKELYNLRADPRETNDLSATQPAKLEELNARYAEYARQAAPPKNTADGDGDDG